MKFFHFRKFVSSVCICSTLLLARTFGRYVHTIFDGRLTYAEYEWRGQRYAIPTEPLKELVGERA